MVDVSLGINIGFLLPMMLLIAYVGSAGYVGLTIRGIRFLDRGYILLGIGLLLVTSLGGWIGSQIEIGGPTKQSDVEKWELAAVVTGAIALIAYCIWFRSFVFNPSLLFRTLTGAFRPGRTNIELTPGVTSLVNMAPVFFSIYAYCRLPWRRPVTRYLDAMCLILLLFTVFRVYAWSERLALIEALVPFGLTASVALVRRSAKSVKFALQLGPFIAIPAVVLYFGIAESVRSWTSSTYNLRMDFWEFAVGRLVSYYYTSLNNGAGLLATGNWPTFQFENTLTWLHKAPFIGPVFSAFVAHRYSQFGIFLERFGDLEFNNSSGNFSVIYDLGLPLGIIYFAVVGLLGGVFYRSYRTGNFVGVLFYPMFFLTFLEVFRYPYLGAPRAFTWLIGICIAFVVSHLSMTRAVGPLRDRGLKLAPQQHIDDP